ncbi:Ceramide synthase 4 [Schistosoma japonicum]|nr:Ceramide synthase 4 [Schistosoma japonicum]
MIVGRCYGCYGFYTLALVVSTFLTNTANKIYLYHISVFKMHYFIWNEKFWLPPNVTWELIQEINSVGISPTLTKTMDCFCVVALLTVIRHYLKECVFIPHGLSFGLRIPKISHVPAAPVLEKVYKKEHKPTQTQIKELSEALNLSDRCIESWFRKRRNQEKFPIIVKFVESEWRLCYYTIMFLYGLFALYDKSYFWDVKETMLNYPYHVLTPEIHWYYMVQLGYYTASSIWIFYEVKRSVLLIFVMRTIVDSQDSRRIRKCSKLQWVDNCCKCLNRKCHLVHSHRYTPVTVAQVMIIKISTLKSN